MVSTNLYFLGRNPSLELSLAEWAWRENLTVHRLTEEGASESLPRRSLFLWIPERYDNAVPQAVERLSKEAPSIVCLPHGAMTLARHALDAGFRDYLCIPCSETVLFHKLDRLLHPVPVVNVVPGRKTGDPEEADSPDTENLAGLIALYGADTVRQITNLAPFPTTVLFQTENGMQTGRAALALHSLSLRGTGPLAQVRLRGLTPLQMGEVLFGAHGKPEVFQAASRGTLYLDGIEVLPPDIQKRLFARLITRVASDLSVETGGDGAGRSAGGGSRDWRFVAGMEIPLEAAVSSGRLDRQLSVQISVVTVFLPPVRDRLKHLPQIAGQLLAELSRELKVPLKTLAPGAADKLAQHNWPGNLDELRAVLEGGLLRSRGDTVEAADLWIEATPADVKPGFIYPVPPSTGHLPD